MQQPPPVQQRRAMVNNTKNTHRDNNSEGEYQPNTKRRKSSHHHHHHLPSLSPEHHQTQPDELFRTAHSIQTVHSSPLQPTTPDQSQCSDHSYESHGWPILTRLDEIGLLSVIEKHAETYSSDLATQQHSSLSLHCPDLLLADSQRHPPPSAQPLPLFTPPPPSGRPQDNKPYKCTLCPKAFTRNYDLTRHKSSHQDQRQHVCSCCGRSFNRRDALIRHTFVRGCRTSPPTS